MSNISVVIRSVGERTESLCRDLLIRSLGVEPTIINERPFAKSLEKGLLYGIEKDKKWTLCTDADLLVDLDGLNRLIQYAESTKDSVFKITPQFFDKFFDDYREGGVHLYRTKYLKEALDYIPSEGLDLRPETHMLTRMRRIGYDFERPPIIIGVHDFDQYYKDIFRKGYVHSHKWVNRLSELVPMWREKAKKDADFRVLLTGVAAGLLTPTDQIRINEEVTPHYMLNMLTNDEIVEKNPIDVDRFNFDLVNQLTNSAQIVLDKKMIDISASKIREAARSEGQKREHLGFLAYFIAYLPAHVLERLGRRIKWELYDRLHIAGIDKNNPTID